MNNDDERDYEEEADNRPIMEEVGDLDNLPQWDGESMSVFPPIHRESDIFNINDYKGHSRCNGCDKCKIGPFKLVETDVHDMSEMAYHSDIEYDSSLPVGYGDECDGESMSVFPDYTPEEIEAGKAEELVQIGETPLPVGYGDEWDGSARNQSNDFFIGHSGHVTILWHIVNNPYERYDSSKSYHMPAKDGSALYVWCELKFTDHQALHHLNVVEGPHIGDIITSINYISE